MLKFLKMLSKDIKDKITKEFRDLENGDNPQVTADIEAVVVLSGESGDPANKTDLLDTQERCEYGIEVYKKIKTAGGRPLLVLNGTEPQNKLMAKIAKQNEVFDSITIINPAFPRASTLTQFKRMKKFGFKKIAVITHAYHAVRVKFTSKSVLPRECTVLLFLLGRKAIDEDIKSTEMKKIERYFYK